MTNEAKTLLDDFVLKVKRVLPDFVLHNPERTGEILTRVRLDLNERAAAEAGSVDAVGEEHLRSVIDGIASIQKYADSFLERGKPRFYISEELAPTYFKVLLLAGIGIFILTLIPQLMKIGQEPGGKIIGYVFSGLFTAAVSVFSFVTLAFAGLSKLGIFPEDLARFKGKAREEAEKHREQAKERMSKEAAFIKEAREKEKEAWARRREEQVRRQEERARKREEIKEKIQRNIEEERACRWNDREIKQRKTRAGEVVGAIFGILFGFFLIVQFPFGILTQSNPLFLNWLRVLGGLIVFLNLWKGVQALIPFDRIWARRIVYAFQELFGLLNVPLFLWLRDNISVVPAFSASSHGLIVHEPSLRATEILYWVFTGIIVLTILGSVIGFIKSLAAKK